MHTFTCNEDEPDNVSSRGKDVGHLKYPMFDKDIGKKARRLAAAYESEACCTVDFVA